MFARLYASLLLFLPIPIIAQSTTSSTPTVVCIPGQCLQGYSNTTIGADITAPGLSSPIHLLPGVYTSTTNPQLLHVALTSSSSSLKSSSGFTNSSSISLPLNLVLESGLSIYSGSLYSGQSAFQPLPNQPIVNASTPLTAKSLAVSSNVWIALSSGSANNRVIVWDAIPDVGQLPFSNQGSLSLTDIQSTACTPGCAASGVCTSAGTCQCAAGFSGVSCESCAPGFFGPQCQACPSNCKTCDEGITGTGRCILPEVANAPATCNCENGVCGTNGQCPCNPGFTTGDNGTLCSKCSPGFFLTSGGDCQVCKIGCTQCSDGSGECTSCKSGFTLNTNDRTQCNPIQQATTSGQVCPEGSFSNGGSCSPCSSVCQSCTGGSSNDCVVCAPNLFTLNGACVPANSDGICQGVDLIADNNKRECDTCGAKCTKCRIPNFSVASTVDQKQCTECLPGFFLNNGACVETCPSGTTVSSQDDKTCIPCNSSCSSCAGTSTFCLTCSNNQLASNGRCVATCPSGTFSASGACLTCNPDCASCTGGNFNQCSSCPSSRPVLTNGRCLPTCAKNQYFDNTSGTCQTCDSTCSSCSGPGSGNCLACSSSTQVLRSGTCVAANCETSSNVVAGLGACLSELVTTTTTGTAPPLPTVTGLETPTVVGGPRRLEWWQILLMALGCAFIFLAFIWCCRRRQRKQRAKKTELFAQGPVTRGRTSWRWRLIRWGEKLFGHTRSRRVTVRGAPIVHLGPAQEPEEVKLRKLRAAEEARSPMATPPPVPARRLDAYEVDAEDEDMVRLIGSYNCPVSPPEPTRYNAQHTRFTPADQRRGLKEDDYDRRSLSDASSRMSAPSIYSQMTGMPRRAPDARQPAKRDLLTSRFSQSTLGVEEDSKTKNPFRK
ncbi:unnamed protein product [Cyclocybe aegerita]|uniref:EGF-like domain-containing protein n=1 Tax=Cyclocybe aegerita TaxID=1973307 RepID=A0A8S0WAB4_CYCAE|nr:unnamed protein product [Cyclocybe aegerita]